MCLTNLFYRLNWRSIQQIPLAMRRSGSLKWFPGFDSKRVSTPFSLNAEPTLFVLCETLRRRRLGVFASFVPREKYAHKGFFTKVLVDTYSLKSGYHSEPDALARASKRVVLNGAQVANSPARE